MSKVTVNIYGNDYTISGERSESEIKSIAEAVDEEMRNISERAPHVSNLEVAVLAALNIKESILMKEDELKAKKEEYKREANLELQTKVKEYDERLRQLQDKVAEYENNFFDLQMENVKMKNELDKIKGTDIE